MIDPQCLRQPELLLLKVQKKLGRWRRVFEIIGLAVLFSLVFCVVGVDSGRGQDSSQKTPSFFYTGNKYLQLKPEARLAYVIGLYDGVQLAVTFGPKKEVFYKLLEGMTAKQIMAMIDKYLNEHPDQWHKPMNYIFFFALQPPKQP